VAASKDSSSVELQNARAYLTSLQTQEGQIDFTYAAELTVHAVVHVHIKMAGPDNRLWTGFMVTGVQNHGGQWLWIGVIISKTDIYYNNHVVEMLSQLMLH